jgi:CheY-like chemotaxis protein
MHAAFGLMELRPDPSDGPAWHTCLNASQSAADRLLRTLDDMRELVSGETPVPGAVEEIDLALCVCEIAGLLNLADGARAARVIVECAEQPMIRQDRPALEQALARILKLTLELSPIGVVRVTLAPAEADHLRLAIVPPSSDVACRLAEWLNADPGAVKFGPDETGTLVSALVAGRRLRVLGGAAEFTCDSGAPTCLSIFLPLQTADLEEACFRPAAAAKPLQVLIAEDSDESYALAEIMLRNESVHRACTGLEAVDQVRQRRFDIVLMDVHMPGMDGYATIRAIRDWETQSGNAHTPIVVLSSDDLGTQTHHAAQSGCSGYLRKPVRQCDLADLLEPLRATRDLMI